MYKTFNELYNAVEGEEKKTVSLVAAESEEALKAINAIYEKKLINAILVGNKNKILEICRRNNINMNNFELIDVIDNKEAATVGVKLVKEKKANILMKGQISSANFLKAVLNRDNGLKGNKIISHCTVFQIENYDRFLYITDAAMNISPNVDLKEKIIENAVELANSLGNQMPKISVVCAIEKVNSKMQATLDAEELVKRYNEGNIKGCTVSGPLAFDNSVSQRAARIKNIMDPNAGKADILLMPNIEAGNILFKALTYFAKSSSASIILGAEAPIVLTSRADSKDAKLNSILLALYRSKLRS